MNNVRLVSHPFVSCLVTSLRNVETETERFRYYTKIVSFFLLYEALENIQTTENSVYTQPGGAYKGEIFNEKVKIFGVLREGISMMYSAMEIFPHAEFDLVGVKRNDDDPFNTQAVVYLNKFKDISPDTDRVILMDQMLATGGTMLALLDSLKKEYGFKGEIDIISVIVAQVGAEKILKQYPEVQITCAGFDTEESKGLNEKGYIYPGLGDAADRYFGVKTNLDNVK